MTDIERQIKGLEARVRELKKRKRNESFNDCIIFENDRVVIEKSNAYRERIFPGLKNYVGKPRRELKVNAFGEKYISTNQCSHLRIYSEHDFDELINALIEAKAAYIQYYTDGANANKTDT